MKAPSLAVSVCVVVGLLTCTVVAVNIETVVVGNPGNAGQLTGAGAGGYGPDHICGSVGYTYNIGKYEVTAGQYCEFLNAVAKTDTYGLYNTDMWDVQVNEGGPGTGCGIRRSGLPGSYTYSVAADWANRPVNYVSWGDAARFCNWLDNDQPTGVQGLSTTEDGSYYLNGAMTNAQLLAVSRKASGVTWAIPSEDEWYKAAYHKNDGVTGHYWDYPTGTDDEPSNLLVNPDPGNNANFMGYGWSIGSPYYHNEVGEFENSGSPYGTFDQGGNVWEWNEAVFRNAFRGNRGGSFDSTPPWDLLASACNYTQPSGEGSTWGFRVVAVPDPATLSLLVLAGAGVVARRRPRA